MIFPYRRLPLANPLPHLGGITYRTRPMVDVALIGAHQTLVIAALLDIGADDTVFPEAVAVHLGLDLAKAPAIVSAGVGLHAYAIRFAPITLRIAASGELREWQAPVGFTTAKLRQAILGYTGFLQFFTATFRSDREEVELTVNASYFGI